MATNTPEKLDPRLDPAVNKCITCGLSRIYSNPAFDDLFVNIGKLYGAKKINYKINRKLIGPNEATIFCSLGLPQAMEIEEPCQFHQAKLDYPPEHYSVIYSATLTNFLAEKTIKLTAKTKCLAIIAIVVAVGLGLLQLGIGLLQIHISTPGWSRKVFHSLLSFFSCP